MATLDELIERLEDARDEIGDGAAEVQLATQPSWPLRYHLRGVYVQDAADDDHNPVVWLVEGVQHYEDPYGVPRGAWEEASSYD